jgi:uncharacterized protein (TIRG00374 family)
MPLWLRIVISLGLLALVIALADWREVTAALKGVDLRWVVVAAGIASVDRLIINRRWQILLAARGIHMTFLPLLRIQLAANFLGLFLPSSVGLDAVRIAALCRAGQPSAQVIAATLVDRMTLMIATLLFGSAMMLALAGAYVPPDIRRFVVIVTAAVVLVIALCLLPSVRRWIRLTVFMRVPERWRLMLLNIAEASLAYRSGWQVILRVIGWTLALFAIRLLFAKAVVLSCGADVSFAELCVVIPVLWIIVMLPITIGGIGVQDAGYVALMSLVGVAPAVAVSMSLVEHVVIRAVTLPGVLFLTGVSNPRATQVSSRAMD